MKLLINIQDVREYRQLSNQVNSDNFEGHVRTVQRNQFQELTGRSLFYDFFNFLDTGWTNPSYTFTRDSVSQITVTGQDLSLWVDYSLKLDSDTFVIVIGAAFGGADTVLTVAGYDLPATIAVMEYRTENEYTKLLNGTVYSKVLGETVQYFGLRAFLAWHFLSSYLTDGNLKQSDMGNINVVGDLFSGASSTQLKNAKSEYLQNATREQNYITEYLNDNYEDFPLWDQGVTEENIMRNDFMII